MARKHRPEDDDAEGEDWKQEAESIMGMSAFYRVVEGGTNCLLASRDPIGDYHALVERYRPRNQRPKDWQRTYDDMLIDYWVFYSQEIQRALPNPSREIDRWRLVYRSCIEDLLTNGELR